MPEDSRDVAAMMRAIVEQMPVPELAYVEKQFDLSKSADQRALLALLKRRTQQLDTALNQLLVWRYLGPLKAERRAVIVRMDEELRRMFEEDRCAFKLRD